MKKRCISIILCVGLSVSSSFGQKKNELEEFRDALKEGFEELLDAFEQKGTNKIGINLAAGINNQKAYEIEVSFTYLPFKYIGGTLGVNVYSQSSFNARIYTGSTNNGTWQIWGEKSYPSWLLFRPAIRFRSPQVQVYDECCLTFNIEPGLYLSPVANDRIEVEYRSNEGKPHPLFLYPTKSFKNSGGSHLTWNMKSFVMLEAGHILFSAGYTVSDFDIYSGRRNIIFDDIRFNSLLPKRTINHTGFIAIGYCF